MEDTYIPALNKKWLTPLYDSVLKWGMREDVFKRHLVVQTHLQPNLRILDLGCGTGTLTILIKQRQPASEVTGLDGDPHVLEIARAKAKKAEVDIIWDMGMAFNMPYNPESFDRVLSCLIIHHLTADNKRLAFQEVLRILKPGGEFHIIDFGKPGDLPMALVSLIIGRLDEAGDNMKGLIPVLLNEAGFNDVQEIIRFKSIFGELVHYQVKKTDRL